MSVSVGIGSVVTTFSGSVEQRYVKLLDGEIAAQKGVLEEGQLDTLEKYKWHAGYLQGLRQAQKLLNQAARDVQQSEGTLRRA